MRRSLEVQQYRVWIVGYTAWSPASWQDVPPRMTALEPADENCFAAAAAADYVAAFNAAMLEAPCERWAVPVPVTIRYEGDLSPGQLMDGSGIARLARLADECGSGAA